MKRVLITGMSGLIGGVLRNYLEERGGYQLSALNRRLVQGVECFQADIADLEAIRPAFVGKDVVVHLAAQLEGVPWESLARTNITGTYNIYEAARLEGVKRVVFASSGSTIRGWDLVAPYDALTSGRYEEVPETWPMLTHEMVRPDGIYAATKIWGEVLGHYYSDAHGISVLCVRIGAVLPENRPRNIREMTAYLSHHDVGNILHRCIEAPEDLKYDVFFATSRNKWGYRDLEHPRQVLGFEPRNSAEVFRQD